MLITQPIYALQHVPQILPISQTLSQEIVSSSALTDTSPRTIQEPALQPALTAMLTT